MNAAQKVEATPILVLGDKRRRELAEHVKTKIHTWLRSWTTSLDAPIAVSWLELSKSSLQQRTFDNCRLIEGSAGGAQHLAIIAGGDSFGDVLDLPRASQSRSSVGTIAGALCEEVLVDLAHTLVASLEFGDWQMKVAAPHTLRDKMCDQFARGWVASIQFGNRAELLEVLFSASLLSQSQPRDVKTAPANLSPRRAAIASEQIRLVAVLGEATVSLGELASLAIDDVIVLCEDLSHAGNLLTDRGRRVASFALGRDGAKRAALIAK